MVYGTEILSTRLRGRVIEWRPLLRAVEIRNVYDGEVERRRYVRDRRQGLKVAKRWIKGLS